MKYLFLTISIIIFISIAVVPLVHAAQTGGGLGFGGFVVYEFPCTCSGGNFWLYMWPFYNPANMPSGGALVYEPGFTYLYSYYAIPMTGVWLLGDYIPGVQACYIYIGTGCAVIPSAGIINSTGTSQPVSI